MCDFIVNQFSRINFFQSFHRWVSPISKLIQDHHHYRILCIFWWTDLTMTFQISVAECVRLIAILMNSNWEYFHTPFHFHFQTETVYTREIVYAKQHFCITYRIRNANELLIPFTVSDYMRVSHFPTRQMQIAKWKCNNHVEWDLSNKKIRPAIGQK